MTISVPKQYKKKHENPGGDLYQITTFEPVCLLLKILRNINTTAVAHEIIRANIVKQQSLCEESDDEQLSGWLT